MSRPLCFEKYRDKTILDTIVKETCMTRVILLG